MIIRKATIKDAKTCYELSKTRALLTAKKEPIALSYFKDIIKEKKTVFLIAEEDGKIIGYSTLDFLPGKLGLWQLLDVHPNHRHKGIGTKLSDEIEKIARKKGVKYLFGYTPLFDTKAQALYKKRGFTFGEKMFEILKILK